MKTPEILYSDEHLIAVNKPAGLLVIPDRFDSKKANLKSIMSHHFGSLFVVHRLDLSTSGVVLMARNAESHKKISEAFEHGQIDKNYTALTVPPDQHEGTIDAPIRERTFQKGTYEVHPSGKPSRTSYRVLEIIDRYALLDIVLHTGRTHQIRVHLKHAGFPLLVDEIYGASSGFYLSSIKWIRLGKNKVERPLLSRTSLHAHRIAFKHPITDLPIRIEAELPKDMRAVLYQLRKAFS